MDQNDEYGSATTAVEEQTTAVRLLLDVDGVLNAVTHKPGDFWPDWNVAKCMGFRITWASEVASFIRSLPSCGVEVIWLTTWAERANEHICGPLNLPIFPVAGSPYDYNGPRWWKLPLAQALYEKDAKPFVWIDDDLPYEIEAREWLSTLPKDSYLAIGPSSIEGLHPRHVEKIKAFIDRHNSDFPSPGPSA